MLQYQDIINAKNLLNLPERASMAEIKSRFRELISHWHPDKCNESPEKCHEMTKKIIDAYNTIIIYCDQYKYSFAEEDIMNSFSDKDWWFKQFGNDPIWGKGHTPE
jgi:DnaJ-class molecular chaperone